jgi:intein/homing endonuclease
LTLGELRKLSVSEKKPDDYDAYLPYNAKIPTSEGIKSTSSTYKTRGKTWKVVTSFGDEVVGLREHRMWALNANSELEFIRLDELKEGLWLPKSVGTRLFSCKVPHIDYVKPVYNDSTHDDAVIPRKITEGLATLFGLYVAEGCRHGGFSNHDRNILLQFQKLLKQEFEANRKISKDWKGIKLNLVLSDFFNKFLGNEKSAGKSVPYIIRTSPERYQVAFLRALFEGDGSIWEHQKSWLCEYSSLSKTLIYQIKAMLENIGILCYVAEGKVKASNGSENQIEKIGYKLRINTVSFADFANRVGFMPNGKKQKTLEYASSELSSRSTNNEAYRQKSLGQANVLPANKLVCDLYKQLERVCASVKYSYTMKNRWGTETTATKTYKVGAVIGSSHHRLSSENGRNMTRHTLQILEGKIDAAPTSLRVAIRKDKTVKTILKSLHLMIKYYWVQVKSSKATGKIEDVYDLTVPGPQSYHVNGLIGHNTAAGLATSLKKTEEYAQELQDTLFAMFPKGAEYLTDTHKLGQRDLFVTTPLGMRRHLWGYLHTRKGVINAMNRRGPNSIIQGVASCIGIASIRLMQKLAWHWFIKHDVKWPGFTISNYVHDSCKSEIPLHLLPIYLYMIEHASTTLVHKRFREVFGYKMSVGLELEFQLGGASSALSKWNFLGDSLRTIVEDTMAWQEKELQYSYSEEEKTTIMSKFDKNWSIIKDIRRRELKKTLESKKPAEYMYVNEENARSLGFVF